MQTIQKLKVQYKGTHDALFKPVKTYDSVNNAFKGIEYASAVHVYRASHSPMHLSVGWIGLVCAMLLITILVGV